MAYPQVRAAIYCEGQTFETRTTLATHDETLQPGKVYRLVAPVKCPYCGKFVNAIELDFVAETDEDFIEDDGAVLPVTLGIAKVEVSDGN